MTDDVDRADGFEPGKSDEVSVKEIIERKPGLEMVLNRSPALREHGYSVCSAGV